jgi:hypothetical protein
VAEQAHKIEVKTYRDPAEDPPPGYQDATLWFTTQYELTCDGRTCYAWAYESKPATVTIPHYREDGKAKRMDWIPYRDARSAGWRVI